MYAKTNEPLYSPAEAVNFYRNSADKTEAIKVIMCGNCMSEAAVRQVLIDGGIPSEDIPTVYGKPHASSRAGRRSKASVQPGSNPESAVPPLQETDAGDAIIQYIHSLRSRRADLQEELDAIDGKLDLIRLAVDGRQ